MTEATHSHGSASTSFDSDGRTDDVQSMTDHAKRIAEDALNEVRGRAGEYIELGRDRAAGMAEAVEQHIRTRPVQAVAIAAGIGVALGYLWSRRS
jgi:ElaB/YqjD/DUF883 family membrane-anchored ribosome-binding protein